MNNHGALILAKNILILANLESLYLDDNNLDSYSAGHILKSLRDLKRLKLISMSSIGLTEEFSEYFNDFITREYPLFQFNLSNNDLKNNFVENIKPYLINMKIQFLELEKSKLDDVGLYFLLNGLIHNSSLFDLNLRQNEFSSEIIPFLRSFLIKNKVLKILRFKFYFVDCYSNSNKSEINFKLLELNKEIKDKNYSAFIEI